MKTSGKNPTFGNLPKKRLIWYGHVLRNEWRGGGYHQEYAYHVGDPRCCKRSRGRPDERWQYFICKRLHNRRCSYYNHCTKSKCVADEDKVRPIHLSKMKPSKRWEGENNHVPTHAPPCLTYPSSQLHTNDPCVFWHCELTGQLFDGPLHSLISVNNNHTFWSKYTKPQSSNSIRTDNLSSITTGNKPNR